MADAKKGRTSVLDRGSWDQSLRAPGRAQVQFVKRQNN